MAREYKLTRSRILAAVEADSGIGFCLACGAERDGCEPDAQNYECESCGEHRVFGAEELMLRYC